MDLDNQWEENVVYHITNKIVNKKLVFVDDITSPWRNICDEYFFY